MKKLSQILAMGVITLAPFVVSPGALAVGTCQIGYTGPDSNNQCISTTSYVCSVENENTVIVENENVQIAVSGDTSGTDNTESGSASSGSATNSNGVTFNATVTNSGICTVVATVAATVPPVTETPTVPAPAGGQGAANLPNTSGDSTIGYLAGLIGILGAAAVLSRLVVLAYSRLKS